VNLADEIEKLQRLHATGALTSEEFAAAKERLIRQGPPPVSAFDPMPPAKGGGVPSKGGGSNFFSLRGNLRALVGLVVLVAVLWIGYSFLVTGNPKLAQNPNRPRTMMEAAGNAIRSPQVVVDEDWIIDSGGMKWLEVTLPSARPVSIRVQGLRDTGKGFSVYRVAPAELGKLKKGKSFKHDPAFHGERVRRFEHIGTVAEGKMAFVVVNSENLLDSMVVRVRIVVDP
jgi:hypothetical protein